MSAFWVGVWASVIGGVVGSGVIGGAVVFLQTRVTNRAAEVQAALLRSSVAAQATILQNRTAAHQFCQVLASLLDTLLEVRCSVLRQFQDPHEAAAAATMRSMAHERVGRYIMCEHRLLVAALPEPQCSWLKYNDGLSGDFDPPATASRETLNRIHDRLWEDIEWLWWAQEVLVTVVAGTSVCPPEPVTESSRRSGDVASNPNQSVPVG